MKNKIKDEKKFDNSGFALMVMGQVGKIDYFDSKSLKTEGATTSQINEWYESNLKKETYNLENNSCKVSVLENDKQVETNLENEKGMENFKRIIMNRDVTDLWSKSNALLILGEIVDSGSNNLKINGLLNNLEMWLKRLRCGWNLFYKNLERFNAAKVVPLDLNSPNSESKVMVDEGSVVIPGSNSFEIDINEEKKIYKEISPRSVDSNFYKYETMSFGPFDKINWDIITYSPKLTTISFHSKFYIQFLDFDSAILKCAKPTQDEYNKCIGSSSNSLEYKDVMNYLEKVQLAINKFRKDTNNEKTWRVMRTTIPPFNSETGDAVFYFQDFTVGTTNINLFKAMKDMSVEMFISSGMKNAQVISIPYNVEPKFKNPKDCADIEFEIFGCYETKPRKFDENPVGTKNCDDKLNYDLPVRDFTDDSENSTMLHVFNIGNSGVDLRPIRGGKLTGGLLIWSRSIENQEKGKTSHNNGLMRVFFGKNYAEVNYYEVQPEENIMRSVAKFNVAPGKLPKEDIVRNYLDNKCQKAKRR